MMGEQDPGLMDRRHCSMKRRAGEERAKASLLRAVRCEELAIAARASSCAAAAAAMGLGLSSS